MSDLHDDASAWDEQDDVVEQDPTERYIRFAEKLGAGAFKTVYRGLDTHRGIEIAWNQVLYERCNLDLNRVMMEIDVFKNIRHENIIEFYHYWKDEQQKQVVFITEIMPSGTLKEYIKRTPELRVKVVKNWCIQILRGLDYLHTLNPPIIHRDIKCDNIFINGMETEGGVKIGDLGLATFSKSKEQPMSVAGTPEFMAPDFYGEKYGPGVDIWAFGMCLIEIFTAERPYAECGTIFQILRKVTSGIRPPQLDRIVNPVVLDFINSCFLEESARPSAKELLSHPFFEESELDNLSVKEVVSTVEAPSNQVEPSKSQTNGTPNPTVPPTSVDSNHMLGSSNENNHSTEPNTNHIQTPVDSTNPTIMPPPQSDPEHQPQGTLVEAAVVCLDAVNADLGVVELKIGLQILRANEEEKSEITFEFNLMKDTASSVAEEMIAYLHLDPEAVHTLSELIQSQVRVLEDQGSSYGSIESMLKSSETLNIPLLSRSNPELRMKISPRDDVGPISKMSETSSATGSEDELPQSNLAPSSPQSITNDSSVENMKTINLGDLVFTTDEDATPSLTQLVDDLVEHQTKSEMDTASSRSNISAEQTTVMSAPMVLLDVPSIISPPPEDGSYSSYSEDKKEVLVDMLKPSEAMVAEAQPSFVFSPPSDDDDISELEDLLEPSDDETLLCEEEIGTKEIDPYFECEPLYSPQKLKPMESIVNSPIESETESDSEDDELPELADLRRQQEEEMRRLLASHEMEVARMKQELRDRRRQQSLPQALGVSLPANFIKNMQGENPIYSSSLQRSSITSVLDLNGHSGNGTAHDENSKANNYEFTQSNHSNHSNHTDSTSTPSHPKSQPILIRNAANHGKN